MTERRDKSLRARLVGGRRKTDKIRAAAAAAGIVAAPLIAVERCQVVVHLGESEPQVEEQAE